MKNIPLHWKILAGMLLGALAGMLASLFSASGFVIDWIKPFGTIFIRMLKMLAVPLILVTLVKGVSSLTDTARLSRMGLRTVVMYLMTTVLAVTIGLLAVNIAQPGKRFAEDKRAELEQVYADKVDSKKSAARMEVSERGPLQALVDIVPENIFGAMGTNGLMLQVIFFSIFLGVSLVLIDQQKAEPVIKLFDGLNEMIIKMILIAMEFAPIGVFALLAGVVADFAKDSPADAVDLFGVLGYYALIVVIGLGSLIFLIYPTIVRVFTGIPYRQFFEGIGPAQLLAFSTSSSAATLPVTMDRVQNQLGVEKEVSSFVLPLGATVNMDGTSLFQAVSALFIAQAYNIPLGPAEQIGIVLTCTLASIGAAAVPGAGTLMLVIVLEQAGLPVEGLALIFAMDRPLDMCRTAVNVTGDAMISLLVAKSEQKIQTS